MTKKFVRCPQCGTSVEYRTDNPSRPFCGSRCKLIDLGAWAEARYAIGATAESNEESNIEDMNETLPKRVPENPLSSEN